MADYDSDSYRQTYDSVMPFWNQARSNMKSYLADQGMLSSTGGGRRFQNEVEMPYSQAANSMYADLEKQKRAEQFQREQQGWQNQFQQSQAYSSNAMNFYNLLWSEYVNQWQLKGTDSGLRAPQDFPIFSQLYNSGYSQPTTSYNPSNVGDGNTEYVKRYSPNQGQTLDAKNSAASQAYQNAYLNYLKERAAASDSQWQAEFDATAGAAGTEVENPELEMEFKTMLAETSDELAAAVEAGEMTKQEAWQQFIRLASIFGKNYGVGENAATMIVSKYGNVINPIFTGASPAPVEEPKSLLRWPTPRGRSRTIQDKTFWGAMK